MLTREKLLEIMMATAERLFKQDKVGLARPWDSSEEELRLRGDILKAGRANRKVPSRAFQRFFEAIRVAVQCTPANGEARDPEWQMSNTFALAYIRFIADDVSYEILPGEQKPLF